MRISITVQLQSVTDPCGVVWCLAVYLSRGMWFQSLYFSREATSVLHQAKWKTYDLTLRDRVAKRANIVVEVTQRVDHESRHLMAESEENFLRGFVR
jgi:hypothetical protein